MPLGKPRWQSLLPVVLSLGAAASFLAVAVGCDRSGNTTNERVVTLYCSVDEPFAKQVIAEFERRAGITVRFKTDQEAGKTTGLVNRIRAEQSNPQADVFWSGEIFNTIKLAREGILVEYRPPAEGILDRYRDPGGRWTAFGLRARVIGYNTDQVKPEDVPTKWRDITATAWQGKLGVADPRFGTTLGHFAAFHALWGEDEYRRFLADLRATTGGRLMDGNATAARRVGSGELLICATDTDDVFARQGRGERIDLVYPDMGDGGTLLIPNSVGLIAGAPHAAEAKSLIDFLTSADVERMLARSDSRNFPVRESLRTELNMLLPSETKLSFDQIADAMDRAIALASACLVQ